MCNSCISHIRTWVLYVYYLWPFTHLFCRVWNCVFFELILYKSEIKSNNSRYPSVSFYFFVILRSNFKSRLRMGLPQRKWKKVFKLFLKILIGMGNVTFLVKQKLMRTNTFLLFCFLLYRRNKIFNIVPNSYCLIWNSVFFVFSVVTLTTQATLTMKLTIKLKFYFKAKSTVIAPDFLR